MKIESYKKLTGGRYKVFLDKNEMILYEDVILKHGLLLKKEITSEEINNILKDNTNYEAYYLALKYIGIKMRSKKEIEAYLIKKEYDNLLINETINKLVSNGFLNDKSYLKAFINDKIYLSNHGPYKIKQELIKQEISEESIDEYLDSINKEIWQEKVTKLVKKKISTNKNLSTSKLRLKILTDLYNLGYEKNMIEEELNGYVLNDKDALEKEYKKAMLKFQKKYSGYELNQNIKNYLYKKGFDLSTISEIIE